MKLAEALQLRADLNRRVEQLRVRLMSNALVQEGERPAEEPAELWAELERCAAELQELMARINLCNSRTMVDGKTLTELIAKKDVLTLKLSALRELLRAASGTAQRATRSEIRILSAVDVRSLQKKADDMAKELRKLDNCIQQTNWMTELE